jgi:hypothetical protein
METTGPVLLVLALIVLLVVLALIPALAIKRRQVARHPERFQRRKGFDAGGILFLAGLLMLGSVFLPWGSKSTGLFEVRYGPNFLTGVLGIFVMVAGGTAGWGRKRSRGVLIGSSVVAIILGLLVAWTRWGNIREIWDGGGQTAVGIWLAFGGALVALLGGVGGVIYALLPGTKIPPATAPAPGIAHSTARAVGAPTLQPPHMLLEAPAWIPTHRVGPEPLAAWGAPDPMQGAEASLDALLPLVLIEQRDDWAHVRAENGWEGWVDGRRLQAILPAGSQDGSR